MNWVFMLVMRNEGIREDRRDRLLVLLLGSESDPRGTTRHMPGECVLGPSEAHCCSLPSAILLTL